MMNSDTKTLLPSLIENIQSDLFTFENITNSKTLAITNTTSNAVINDGIISNISTTDILFRWNVIINTLPLKYREFIESYPDIYTIEKFDKKYIHNPKLCAYERYGTTNMWRPLMSLNKCSSITRFNFDYIKYYNITVFSKLISVLMSRNSNE